MNSKPKRVAVIGAGHVGLLFMRNILRGGHNVIGFEQRSKVGGMWNFESNDNGRGYDDLNKDGSINCGYSAIQLNTSKVNILASDDLLGDHQLIPTDCQWLSTEEFLKSMSKTAENFNLIPLIKFNTQVTKLEKLGKKGWSVAYTCEGKIKVETFDFVVCCTGGFRFPKMPSIPNMDVFKGISIHSGQIRIEENLFPNRKIIVIGGSFSGTDIAYYALQNKAEKVYWMVTRGTEKRNYWLLDRTPSNGDPNKPFDLNFCRYAWFDKPEVAQNFMTSITTPICGGGKVTLPADKLGVSEIPYLMKKLEDKKLVTIEPVRSITETGVELENGTKIDADVIVYCTGFESRFPVLDSVWPLEEQVKNELYYHLLPVDEALDGIAIAGANEAITSKTSIYELQARWLVEFWLTRSYDDQGHLFTPNEMSIMKRAVDIRREAKSPGARFNYIIDIWALCDSLASDIGCLPKDYRALICSKSADPDTKKAEVELGIALMMGPMVSVQFRIHGTGAFEAAARYFVGITRTQVGEKKFEKSVMQALEDPEGFLREAGIKHDEIYCVKPYFLSLLK